MQKIIQNPSNPSQESVNIGINAAHSQETDSAQQIVHLTEVQPPMFLYHSEPIEATQQRVQQISRQQTFGHQNSEGRANNVQQLGTYP